MARVVRESFRKKADHQQFGGWWTIWNSSRYVTYVKEKQKVGKDSQASNGGFLKWWYPQNTPKWSFLVGKILGNPQATSPKNFQSSKRIGESFDLGGLAFSFGSVGAQPWVSRKRLVFRFPPPCLGLVFFSVKCWDRVLNCCERYSISNQHLFLRSNFFLRQSSSSSAPPLMKPGVHHQGCMEPCK